LPVETPSSDPDADVRFMRRALRLAMNGRGSVEPNPMVGCVLVKDGRVVGEGFHAKFGGPHAEPAALAACAAAGHSPEGATAYVTLEPCCHTNKKTPPCVPRLVDAKVGRVVVGCLDPNPDVNGKALAMLRQAGITVDGPLLESEAKQLIAPFLRRIRRLPYVTLKWAQTRDGKVAGPGGGRVQISNPASSRAVHELRSRCDGILVGVRTVLTDDPVLTARHTPGARQPARFVLDRDLRLPLDARLVREDSTRTTVFRGYDTSGDYRHKRDALENLGVHTTLVKLDKSGRLALPDVLRRVADVWCSDLLVEPGPTLAASFINEGLADRLWIIRSPRPMGEPSAPAATAVPATFVRTGEVDLEGDVLTEYLNPQSDVFFSPQASADFVRLAETTRASAP
jgi:diaminohydroxyphosphoribosylaminopyrimidine deaminase/5-amino-6-(5-phosphoribosylamino)uracil reductase